MRFMVVILVLTGCSSPSQLAQVEDACRTVCRSKDAFLFDHECFKSCVEKNFLKVGK